MARVYSEQLYIAHNINSGSFTVPADQVWVLRDLTMFAATPLAGGAGQLVDRDSNCTFWWFPWDPTADTGYIFDVNRRIVRPAGSTTDIIIDAGLGEGADVLISGYALSLP